MLLPLPETLNANPHYYDYLCSIELGDDGTVELVYGEGQGVRGLLRGRFSLIAFDATHGQLALTDIARYAPYTKEKEAALPPVTIGFTREAGQFALRQEVLWTLDNPDAHPCLLFTVRYVFERDPFDALGEGDNERIYYPQAAGQSLSLKDLRAMSIEPPPFA